MFRRMTPPLRYALPVVAVATALLLALLFRWAFQPTWPGQISSPLLLAAVALSAWYGGNTTGLFMATLSLLSLEYLFLPPIHTVDMQWADLPRLVTFLGAALVVARLTAKRRQAEISLHQAEKKAHAAREVQQRLFPSGAPALSAFDIAGASFPADTVGGDYFDFFPLRGGTFAMVVGDVSGHGLGPALLMAETRACIRTLALTHDNVGEILTLTNRILVEDTDEQFITLFVASLDPRTRSFVYAGAGHGAFLPESAGEVRRLGSTSLPLGLKKDLIVPCSSVIDLAPGDVLLLLTDGVCETFSRGGIPFGMERTLEVVRANRARSAREIIDRLYGTVRNFAQRQPQADDITIITLKAQAAA